MKKTDALVVGILLLLAAGLFLLSGRGFFATGSSVAMPAGMFETAPAPASALASATAEANAAAEPAVTPMTRTPSAGGVSQAAYLLVTVRGVQYEPILLEQEADFTLRQKDTGAVNVIHVTKDSIRMASSTCENQDCVEQGVVSVSNRNQRVLRNMIICLPNEVTLELLSAEEADRIRAGNGAVQ